MLQAGVEPTITVKEVILIRTEPYHLATGADDLAQNHFAAGL